MPERTLAVFCCENSGIPALDSMPEPGLRDVVDIVRLPCSGKVEVGHILRSIERGYSGVLVLGCPLESCTYLRGSHRASRRVERARGILKAAGLSPEMARMCFVSSVDGYKAAEAIREMLGLPAATEAPQGRSDR